MAKPDEGSTCEPDETPGHKGWQTRSLFGQLWTASTRAVITFRSPFLHSMIDRKFLTQISVCC